MISSPVYFRPLIPFLFAFIVGIYSGSRLPGYDGWGYSLMGISLLLIFLCLITEKRYGKLDRTVFHHLCRLVCPFLLFSALGYLSIQPWVNPRFTDNHINHVIDTGKYEIAGHIIGRPQVFGRRKRFILEVETLAKNDRIMPASGKLRVTVYGESESVHAGDRISFISRIRSIRNFNNPGGFDYQRYMAFQKIWTTAYTQGNGLRVLDRSRFRTPAAWMERNRERIADFIRDTISEEDRSVLLQALILGDKSGIPRDTREKFNRAGVAHVLAISGLHIGIIAMVFFALFQKILSLSNYLLWQAWVKRGAAFLSLMPVIYYGLLSGLSPSTQRAVIMVSVFLITFVLKRDSDTMNTLALAALAILLVNPPSLFSISFQLSFITVFFIIYGLAWMYDIKTFHLNPPDRFQIPEKVFAFAMVSLFAFIGSLPVVMYYFNQASTMGILANFLIIPLVGFIVVPMGLTSIFLYPISTTVAAWLLKGSSFVIGKSVNIISSFADLPFAAVKTITPTFLEIACFYILILVLMNWKKMRPAKYAAIAVILIFAADTLYWLEQRFWHDDLRITVLDVGQGSSALLEMPGGHTVLIDGGGFSDNTYFDMGERVVAPFLWQKKIKTIDTMILSHPHSDHMNGLIYIAEHFKIKRVWANGETSSTYGYRKFKEVTEKKKIDRPVFESMKRKETICGVTLEILYPENAFLAKRNTDRWRDKDNNSLVVKAGFASTAVLFPGDIGEMAEMDMVSIKGSSLKSDILLCPHHGSNTSSSGSFLDTIDPEYVIISCGWQNRFGFPHPEVMERYEVRGCKVYRTDHHGAVEVRMDGEDIKIETTIQDVVTGERRAAGGKR